MSDPWTLSVTLHPLIYLLNFNIFQALHKDLRTMYQKVEIIICLWSKTGLPKNAVAVRKDRNDGIKNSKREKRKRKTPQTENNFR